MKSMETQVPCFKYRSSKYKNDSRFGPERPFTESILKGTSNRPMTAVKKSISIVNKSQSTSRLIRPTSAVVKDYFETAVKNRSNQVSMRKQLLRKASSLVFRANLRLDFE